MWYKIIRTYVHIGLLVYFKKIEVIGKENVPKNTPVLFVANHRNGLIDPILIATNLPILFHFLTRASAFKNSIASFFLRSINMIPIYRIRDGVDTLQKNQEVFEQCYTIFDQNESVLIFPEGNHGFPRRVRTLSKGFIRIAFGYLEKNAEKDLLVIPVGINYENLVKPFKKVAIHIGKPFAASEFYNPNDENSSIENFKTEVFNALTELTTHIESLEQHDLIENKLKSEGIDFTNPVIANQSISALNLLEPDTLKVNPNQVSKESFLSKVFTFLFSVNTIIPILAWQKIKQKVKDIVMLSTYRLAYSIVLIPLSYLLFAILVGSLFGSLYGWVYLVISFGLAYARKYL